MKILLCGKSGECLMTNEYITAMFPDGETAFCADGEELLRMLTKQNFDMAMVAFDGADGMETVMALRRQRPDLPVVWFSDDDGFAAQAYRLNAAYFHKKPITQQILDKALVSCGLVITEVR